MELGNFARNLLAFLRSPLAIVVLYSFVSALVCAVSVLVADRVAISANVAQAAPKSFLFFIIGWVLQGV